MNLEQKTIHLIEYIKKHEPKEIFMDVTGIGLTLFKYVSYAVKASPTKIVGVHAIGKTDGMAFRRV
jgi:hypothetical protein